MTSDDQLTALFDAATRNVPERHHPYPLESLHARIRRRQRTVVSAAAVALVAVVASGIMLAPRMFDRAALQPALPSPPPVAWTELSWSSAYLSLDDVTVSVYLEHDEACLTDLHPEFVVTPLDATRVAIAIRTAVEVPLSCARPTGDVSTMLVVHLPAPLRYPILVNSAVLPVPIYRQGHLPTVDARWTNARAWNGGGLWTMSYLRIRRGTSLSCAASRAPAILGSSS